MAQCPTCGEEPDPLEKLDPIGKAIVYLVCGLIAVAVIIVCLIVVVLLFSFLGRIT